MQNSTPTRPPAPGGAGHEQQDKPDPADQPTPTPTGIELSIVMPCLNESRTLPACIRKALGYLEQSGVVGEVIVADNGSTDGSQQIATDLGARVVDVPAKGYGSALAGGINAAHGKYIIMGDSDESYDFSALAPFVEKLRAGYDLVMGNRFAGGIADQAMPPLHRYFGNPFLTAVGRIFFKSRCKDFYCGLRGFSKDAYQRMQLRSPGMEFALEMVVKSTMFGMRVTEVPTTLSPDGRDREPHLRRWRDGWRSLRFYLLYSPKWLFWYPGLVLLSVGLIATIALMIGPINLGQVTFDVRTLLFATTAVLLGFQLAAFAVFAKLMAIEAKLHPPNPKLARIVSRSSLERGLIIGITLLLAGLAIAATAVILWSNTGFGDLTSGSVMRLAILACLALTLGLQCVFSSFYLALFRFRTPPQHETTRQ